MDQPQIEVQDMLAALSNQRNGALDENVKLFALVESLKRKVQQLEEEKNAATPAE